MFFTSFSRNSRARNSEYVRYAENYFEIIEKFENNNPCFIDCKNDYDNLKQKGQRLFEKSKKLKKVLLIPTGAIFSPTMVFQKETIPAIAHAFSLEVIE